MKRWIIAICAVAALTFGSYGWAWLESYQLTRQYLAEAEASLAGGDLAGALKGKERRDPQSGAVVFAGGYQQVLDLWSSPGAWPKPAEYYAAREAIAEILQYRLTVQDGITMFQNFYGRDNGLLPDILLRVGALLEEQGDTDGAEEIYQTVIDAFPVRPEIVEQAQRRLEALKAHR